MAEHHSKDGKNNEVEYSTVQQVYLLIDNHSPLCLHSLISEHAQWPGCDGCRSDSWSWQWSGCSTDARQGDTYNQSILPLFLLVFLPGQSQRKGANKGALLTFPPTLPPLPSPPSSSPSIPTTLPYIPLISSCSSTITL